MAEEKSPAKIAWEALKLSGRATGRAAAWVGRKASAAYLSIDPELGVRVAELPLADTTMVGPRVADAAAMPDDGHRVVVCVHGLAGHRQNFFPLRAYLRIHGRHRAYSLGYDDDEPLETAAIALVRAVEDIRRVNERAEDVKVDLVAHSMGGIVARLALLDATFAARVHTFVTLGTPHQGTLAARYLATPRSLDLRPGSPIFQRLAAQVPWAPPLPTLIAFHSPADILMLPASTASLPGADNRELANVSHSGYLVRPRVLAQVEVALR